MQKPFQAQLTSLGRGVQATAMSDGCKHTAAWCVGQLPSLYAMFEETKESRYSDKITRVVQALLNEVAGSEKTWAGGRKLADSITNKFQLLHEQFGLPRLKLKALAASPPRSRKTA